VRSSLTDIVLRFIGEKEHVPTHILFLSVARQSARPLNMCISYNKN